MNVTTNLFVFDISDVCRCMKDAEPNKTNAVSLATRFFDPFGITSPILLCSLSCCFIQLCEMNTTWDEPLTGMLQAEGGHYLQMLNKMNPFRSPTIVLKLIVALSRATHRWDFAMHPRRLTLLLCICVLRVKLLFTQIFCAQRPELHPLKESLSLG